MELFKVLSSDPRAAETEMRNQINGYLISISLTRLANTIERRLGDPLGIKAGDIQTLTWEDATGRLLDAVDGILSKT